MQPLDWCESAWDGHLVLAYDSEQARRAGVVSWASRGLASGAKVLYLEDSEETGDRSVTAVLSEGSVDIRQALTSGQFQVVHSVEDALDPEWRASVVDESLAAGYPTVRFSGDVGLSWTVKTPLAHLDVERATDTMCRSGPVSVMCQYPTHLTASALQDACAVHSAGLRGSLLGTVPTSAGVAVAGEVDASNERIWRSVLAAATADMLDGLGAFVVDLSGLQFLDVSGARALVTATAPHRIRGGIVRLLAPQPAVDRLLRLLDLDVADGFILEGA